MTNDSAFQVLEFEKLRGVCDYETAAAVEVMNSTGAKLKQVRIILDHSAVKIEPGVVSYMKGSIEKKNSTNKALSLGKKLISSKFSSEVSEDKPIYGGHGEIFLEPSFQHFVLVELEDEEIIIDDKLFLACEDTIEIKSVIAGRKYENVLSGSGIVVLELPVPADEIFKCKIFNDQLKVDGDFAVLRSGSVEYSTEHSAMVSGSGMINVYNGIGDIWLLPTKDIYSDLKYNGKEYDYNDNDDDE